MRNIFKIALFAFLCGSNAFASTTKGGVILNESNTLSFNESSDSTKVAPPESREKNSKYTINTKNATDIVVDDNTDSYVAEQLINVASENLGTNYRSGGTTPAGYDCSGLMYATFNKFNIALPRSSYQMAEVGTTIDVSNARKGDLIFFINRGQSRINHVGMIVEVDGDDIKFIHSSTNGGVIISSLKESYYERTFKQINRVIE